MVMTQDRNTANSATPVAVSIGSVESPSNKPQGVLGKRRAPEFFGVNNSECSHDGGMDHLSLL